MKHSEDQVEKMEHQSDIKENCLFLQNRAKDMMTTYQRGCHQQQSYTNIKGATGISANYCSLPVSDNYLSNSTNIWAME